MGTRTPEIWLIGILLAEGILLVGGVNALGVAGSSKGLALPGHQRTCRTLQMKKDHSGVKGIEWGTAASRALAVLDDDGKVVRDLVKYSEDVLPSLEIFTDGYRSPRKDETVLDYLQELYDRLMNDEKLNTKWILRSVIPKLIKLIKKVGPEKLVSFHTTLLKSSSHPLGYVADIAQFTLELAGYETAGALVGCAGHILTGVLVGCQAGSVGCVVGGAIGFGFWYLGQMADHETVEYLEFFIMIVDQIPCQPSTVNP